MKNYLTRSILWNLFFILLSFDVVGQSFVAKKGVLDLRTIAAREDYSIDLDGEWEFYYGNFLLNHDFDTLLEKEYRTVPSASWHDATWQGRQITGHGIASYRLRVLLPAHFPKKLAIRSYEQSSALEAFANGTLLGNWGVVGRTDSTSVPKAGAWLLDFTHNQTSDTLDLVFHVSNFHHRKGGLWHSLTFGDEPTLRKARENAVKADNALFAGFLIMAFYHLILFALRTQNRSPLYFAMACLFISIRLIATGDSLIVSYFPSMTWQVKYFSEYISLYVTVPFVFLFLKSTFPDEFPKWFFKIFTPIATIFVFLPIVLPLNIYSYSISGFQLFAMLTAMMIIYAVVLASLRKRVGSRIFLLGSVGLLTTCVNDILFSLLIINTMYLLQWGFFAFFFSQAIILSVRSAAAFNKVEQLSTTLTEINTNLENIVQQRTKQIRNASESLISSLQYAKRIQEAILPDKTEIEKYLPNHFIYYQPRDIVSGDFYYFDTVIDENNQEIIILAVVDCTGHGVPGAFMSIIGKDLLNQIIVEKKIISPEKILDELHLGVRKTLKQQDNRNRDGMDIGVVVIDPHTKTISFAGAKNSLYMYQNHEFKIIKGDRKLIGGVEYDTENNFTKHTFSTELPTIFYLFTDGYVDQFGGTENKKFLAYRFRHTLSDIYKLPPKAQQEILSHTFHNWRGNKPQTDDILVVGVKL